MKQILYILMLLPAISFADSTTINCTPPTERADNTPLLASEIQGYKFYWLDDSSLILPGIQTECNTTINIVGQDRQAVVTTIDTDGRESAYSLPVLVKAGLAVPKSPQVTATHNIGDALGP